MTVTDAIAERLAQRYFLAEAKQIAEDAITALLSTPDLEPHPELAARLNPWREIETVPKDGTMILTSIPWLPYAKVLFWATYANDWRCPATEDATQYEPTHWKPLDLPSHCTLLPAPPSEDNPK